MTHVRKQIRDLAVTTATGLATTGARVYESRLHELSQGSLPCWVVTTDSEEIEDVSMAMGTGPEQMRHVALEFTGYARGVSGVEDTLDQMAEELEAVILPFPFRNLAKDVQLRSTEIEMTADDLDNTFGIVTLAYRVTYHTTAGVPGTAV